MDCMSNQYCKPYKIPAAVPVNEKTLLGQGFYILGKLNPLCIYFMQPKAIAAQNS